MKIYLVRIEQGFDDYTHYSVEYTTTIEDEAIAKAINLKSKYQKGTHIIIEVWENGEWKKDLDF